MQDHSLEVLNERETTHGSFTQTARIAQVIKHQIRVGAAQSGVHITAEMSESLDLIATKIARIVSGNPTEVDHWRDIAGYATLVAEKLEGK